VLLDLFLRFPIVAIVMGALLGLAAWWRLGTPPQRGGFWAALRDAVWPIAIGMILGASIWVLLDAPRQERAAPQAAEQAGPQPVRCKRCF